MQNYNERMNDLFPRLQMISPVPQFGSVPIFKLSQFGRFVFYQSSSFLIL